MPATVMVSTSVNVAGRPSCMSGSPRLEDDRPQVRGGADLTRGAGAVGRVVRVELARVDAAVLVAVLGAVVDAVSVGVALGRVGGGRGSASTGMLGQLVASGILAAVRPRSTPSLMPSPSVSALARVGLAGLDLPSAFWSSPMYIAVSGPSMQAVAVGVLAQRVGLAGSNPPFLFASSMPSFRPSPSVSGLFGSVSPGSTMPLWLRSSSGRAGRRCRCRVVRTGRSRPACSGSSRRVDDAVLVQVFRAVEAGVAVGVGLGRVGLRDVTSMPSSIASPSVSVLARVGLAGVDDAVVGCTSSAPSSRPSKSVSGFGGVGLGRVELAVVVRVLDPVGNAVAVTVGIGRHGCGRWGRRRRRSRASGVDRGGAAHLDAVGNAVAVGVGVAGVGPQAAGVDGADFLASERPSQSLSLLALSGLFGSTETPASAAPPAEPPAKHAQLNGAAAAAGSDHRQQAPRARQGGSASRHATIEPNPAGPTARPWFHRIPHPRSR